MSIGAIPNLLHSPDLDVVALSDPEAIQVLAKKVADQINDQSSPKFTDLSDRISDIIIETSAQGASLLEVHVIDPLWVLLISGFISVDDDGYLAPPIELNFPPDTTDCVWRLCQVRPSTATDRSQANLVLTFEDRIASVLREVNAKTGGVKQGGPTDTLGGFIQRLVDGANKAMGANIKLVLLIAKNDPNYRLPAPPKSAVQGHRPNPNKGSAVPAAISAAQAAQLEAYQQTVSQLFGITPGGLAGPAGGPLTIGEIEQNTVDFFQNANRQTANSIIAGL